MNAYSINMTCESMDFERLQNIIFNLDPKAKISVSSEPYSINSDDLQTLKSTIKRVKNRTETLYSHDEAKNIIEEKLKTF